MSKKMLSGFLRVLFFLYVVIIAAALVVFFMDYPLKHSGGMYSGMIGTIAVMVAAVPWSIMMAESRMPIHISDASLYLLLWSLTAVNIWLFYLLAFRKERATSPVTPDSSGSVAYGDILRDAAVIWIATMLINKLVLAAISINGGAGQYDYQHFQIIQRVNMVSSAILFCVSHALAKHNKFRHIIMVAVCLSIVSMLRYAIMGHAYYTEGLMAWLWAQRFLYAEMLIGGLISHLFISQRNRGSVIQSAEMDSAN